MISSCPPYYSSAASCLLHSHHVLLFRLVASDCLSCSTKLGRSVLSSSLALSLSPCRSHPVHVFIFCLAILLAFCLLFSAMRQLLSDIEKLGCGCHTRAPKPISVSCVCRGAEATIPKAIGNRKRDCAWGCASVKKKNQFCWAHSWSSPGEADMGFDDLCSTSRKYWLYKQCTRSLPLFQLV